MSKQRPRSHRRRILTGLGVGLGIVALLLGGGYLALQHWIHAQFPPIEDSTLESGQWYSVHPDGALNAAGEPYHANVRIGAEDRIMVLFAGGGVSVDAYTEARPVTGLGSEGFYNVLSGFDQLAKDGLGDSSEENPFRDWTIIQLPYSTGDFHTGNGVNVVEGIDGEEQTVHHVGFSNVELVLDEVKPYLGTPTDLLVAGSSAGGFAAAMMTGAVMEQFPTASNVTTMVDSSLLLHDWKSVSVDIWKSPAAVTDVLTSDNFTADALRALRTQHPSVKILMASSLRDGTLAQMQSYLDGGAFSATMEDGTEYQENLAAMIEKLEHQVPGIGFYVFEGSVDAETGLTQHTIGSNFDDPLVDDTTPLEWVYRAVQGKVASHGLELLQASSTP
jgi:hypothetical protein